MTVPFLMDGKLMVMPNYTATVYKDDQEPFLEAENLNKNEQQTRDLTDALRNVQTSLESGQVAQAINELNDIVSNKADKSYTDTELGKKQDASSALKVGTTETTAKAGNYSPKVEDISDATSEGKNLLTINIHKAYNEVEPVVHTGPVDYFSLDYGEHLIRSDTTTNAPPDTRITRAVVTKTHNEVGSGGSGAVQPSSVFEQGTISESSAVGTDYDLSKYPATEPLHGSRIRTIAPIAINEFSTISIASGFDYCVTYFDENQKYLGRSSFMGWGSENRLTYPEARYIGVAIKKSGVTVEPITPSDATQAKLTVSVLGQIAGGSKQIIAYGLLKGDVWECFNSAGAWGAWIQTSSALPLDANEGDYLRFRGGKWVAEAPTP